MKVGELEDLEEKVKGSVTKKNKILKEKIK